MPRYDCAGTGPLSGSSSKADTKGLAWLRANKGATDLAGAAVGDDLQDLGDFELGGTAEPGRSAADALRAGGGTVLTRITDTHITDPAGVPQVCVCDSLHVVLMCVCQRERERQRERDSE